MKNFKIASQLPPLPPPPLTQTLTLIQSPPTSHISITDASVTLTPDRNILYKIVSSTPSGVEQTSTTTVHAPTGELTGAIMGENTDEDTSFHVKGGGEVNKLYRDIVEDEGDDSKIVYWKIKLDEKVG